MANLTNFLARVSLPTTFGGGGLDTVGRNGRVQTPKTDLVINAIMAQEDVGAPVTLWASLENSVVRPGKPLVDDADDTVGYFQDRVDVTMWLAFGNDDSACGHFLRTSDGPQTYNGSGSVSSSVSVSLSGSLNVGFFGGVPTGGLGLGGGSTDTHSFSQSLQDFEVVNDSDDKVVRHSYVMSKSDGASYSKPEDLVPSLSLLDRFSAIKLHRPPALAIDNLPLLSQGVWQSTALTHAFKPHALRIYIKQSLTWVTAINEFFRVRSSPLTALMDWNHTVDIPFDQLVVKTI